MLFYVHIQIKEPIYADEGIKFWLRNVDFFEAYSLLEGHNPVETINIDVFIPQKIKPIIITNDLNLSLLYRTAFDLNEFKNFCGLSLRDDEKRSFYNTNQIINNNSVLSEVLEKTITEISLGKYNFASVETSELITLNRNLRNGEIDVNFGNPKELSSTFLLEFDDDCLKFTDEEISHNNNWKNLPKYWKYNLIKNHGKDCFYNYETDKETLTRIFNIEEIVISSTYDLSHLKYFKNLKKLKINPIFHQYSKQEFDILRTKELCCLSNLEYLDISGTTVDSLEFIWCLQKLKHLNLSNVTIYEEDNTECEFSDLNLEYLDLFKCNFSNYDFLNYMQKLRFLKLNKTNFDKFEVLLNMTELEELDISATSIEDLRFLRNLLKLKKLDLNNTRISEVKEIGFLSELSYLDISKNKIESILPLFGLGKLETLLCNDCQLKSLTPLKNIKRFEIQSNNEIDIDEIKEYEKLIGYKIENFLWQY